MTDILVIQCVVGYFTCEKSRADNMGKQNYNYQRDGCGSEWQLEWQYKLSTAGGKMRKITKKQELINWANKTVITQDIVEKRIEDNSWRQSSSTNC